MKVELIDGGKNLQITLPVQKTTSKSGKSIIVAGTNGFQSTSLEVDGKTVSVSVNATIPIR